MSSHIKNRLQALGIQPKKTLGQNFCIDQRLAQAVLARLGSMAEPMEIWEIGPGTGSLTEHLLGKASRLRLFEIDERLRDLLQELVGSRPEVTVHWGDVLKADLAALVPSGPFVVCGNLPYYCGTAILREMLGLHPSRLVFLLQKEVVDKMCASPGEDDYGYLSVTVQLLGKVVAGEVFSCGSFYPNPQIDSRLVEITPFRFSEEELEWRRRADRLASVVFGQRRKMALSLLKKARSSVQPAWEERFAALGLSPQIRAEKISPQQFLELARPGI